MTYTCDDLIDEEVETFEYCPRSFVEQLPSDLSSTPSSPCENNNSNSNSKTSPKRGSFTELRNTILTKVSTPRGHRRSKTQIKRAPKESTTRNKVERALSLDLLGNTIFRKPTTSTPTVEKEDLMKGFSQMIVGMNISTTKTSSAENIKSADISRNDKQTCDSTVEKLTVRYPYKDRSMSCPTNPSIKEERTPVITKSVSYDSGPGYVMNQPSKSCPVIIKIDLCSKTTDNNNINNKLNRVPKSAPLQRRKNSTTTTTTNNTNNLRSEKDGDLKSASTSSLCSASDSGSISYLSGSDSSSVFNSDHSLNSSGQQQQRPFSYIDIFKRDNQVEFNNSSTYTLPRGGSTTKKDCNCNTVLHQSSIDLTSEIEIDFMDHYDSRVSRARASSMIEIGGNKKNKKTEKPLSPATKKHEQLKKTTSNIYGLASPALFKKIFKKKKSSLSTNYNNNNNNMNKKNKKTDFVTTPCLDEGVHPNGGDHHDRKCVHIESFV